MPGKQRPAQSLRDAAADLSKRRRRGSRRRERGLRATAACATAEGGGGKGKPMLCRRCNGAGLSDERGWRRLRLGALIDDGLPRLPASGQEGVIGVSKLSETAESTNLSVIRKICLHLLVSSFCVMPWSTMISPAASV